MKRIYVKKRDGRRVLFNEQKIINAVLGAFKDIYNDIDDYAIEKATNIANYIREVAENTDHMLTVEDISDLVEKGLMSCKAKEVAKQFILYRQERTRVRELNNNFWANVRTTLMAEDVKNSNANVDEYSFGGRKFEAAGILTKKIAMDNMINPSVAQAFRENRIYIHDMDNYATGMHNCCKKDTRFITDKGVYSFADFNDGDEIIVKTHLNNWKKAVVRKLGKQMLNKISFCRSQNIQTEYFTPNHRWILQDGTITENIKIGDKLFKAPCFEEIDFESLTNEEKKYWCLGFILGDGVECYSWSHGKRRDDSTFIRLRLCGDKIKYLNNFKIFDFNYSILENGDYYLTFSNKNDLHKKMPDLNTLSIREKQILFQGLYAADGAHTGTNMSIVTTSEEIASFIEDIIPSCGYYILKINDFTGEKTNFGIRKFTKEYRFISQKNKYCWTVVDIEPYQEEDVWCLDVEDDHSFILPNGIVTGNCLFCDLAKLLREGFSTRNGDVRPANSINTAFQLTAVIFQCQSQVQFGGVASAHLDFDLAPYVRKSFFKHWKDGRKYIMKDENADNLVFFEDKSIDDDYYKENNDVYNYATSMTEKETNQAAQAFFHNMNTLESRAGSQVPFSSINFGRDTSVEGRMVIKALLNASIEGIGKNHRTSIFPISIFQYKKGVNAHPGDPNYDLKQLAIKSLSKRIYPNFVNCDFSGDHEEEGDPDTYSASMGCRTRMGFDRNGLGWKKVGRGNVSPVTINLPKIGIKHGICLGERNEADIEGFYRELREILEITEIALLDRYKLICSQNPKSGTFMYNNNTISGFDGETIESAMKHGTQAIGFVGLAETLQALFGKNQVDEETRRKGLEIVKYIYDFTKEASERNNLNFSCYFTPAESCAGKMCILTRDEFGIIPNVTDREYFTNSVHVPVWEEVGLFEKIDIEREFNPYGLGGQITYAEIESKVTNNLQAIETLIDYAMNNDICYFAINFPIDTCLDCGLSDDINDTCPKCGSHNIEHLARITGYLTTSVEKMNKAKQAEVRDRFKHSKKTDWGNYE